MVNGADKPTNNRWGGSLTGSSQMDLLLALPSASLSEWYVTLAPSWKVLKPPTAIKYNKWVLHIDLFFFVGALPLN
jgi:hypothetical protein